MAAVNVKPSLQWANIKLWHGIRKIIYARPYLKVSYNSDGQKSPKLVEHDSGDEMPFDKLSPQFWHGQNKTISCLK